MKNEELLDLITKGYEMEMTSLSFIAGQEEFPNMLSILKDYKSFIQKRSETMDKEHLLSSVKSESGVITARSESPILREIFLLAHLACCCELLQGWTLNINIISSPEFFKTINKRILSEINKDPDLIYDYAKRLNNADAMRTIQILKLLGLLEFSSSSCRQLSLCAGFGRKDIYAVHATPAITHNPGDDILGNSNVSFSTSSDRPEQITLVDNDKSLQELYGNYNSESNGFIYAMNDDASHALDRLPGLIHNKSLAPYNLILGIRIDHRMVDDVPDFFRQLALVASPEADLVITIGAGFSESEFEGRVSLIERMFDHLEDRGLDPTRITLHTGETTKDGRERPAFGYAAVATHEVLHCKLYEEQLQ